MQDIGGCRAVVGTVLNVRQLRRLYTNSRHRHELVKNTDYILQPKKSGYRGIHLVYKYRNKNFPAYNGLLIEIQLRSRLQHIWATAVETAGTFLNQALKSSEGPKDWLRFFALTSSAFALSERTPPVPNTPEDQSALLPAMATLAKSLDVQERLYAYGQALKFLEDEELRGAHYYLLQLRPAERRLTITQYTAEQLDLATANYLSAEKDVAGSPGAQVVLVVAESVEALRRSYPNYFLDTQEFIEELRQRIGN